MRRTMKALAALTALLAARAAWAEDANYVMGFYNAGPAPISIILRGDHSPCISMASGPAFGTPVLIGPGQTRYIGFYRSGSCHGQQGYLGVQFLGSALPQAKQGVDDFQQFWFSADGGFEKVGQSALAQNGLKQWASAYSATVSLRSIIDSRSLVQYSCYALTLALDAASGGGLPTASPANSGGCAPGSYHADTAINVAASPSPDWKVGSWSGTNDNSSNSATNNVTMPAGNHTVTVNYLHLPRICYTLTLTRNTASGGGLPRATPANSSGCAFGSYFPDTAINLVASPSTGWRVVNWRGTNGSSGFSTTSSVTMPWSNHAVTVNYLKRFGERTPQ
jgi:hypothetical protein